MNLFQIALTLFLPALILWAVKHNKLCDLIGPVVLAYGGGVLLGNLLPFSTATSKLLTEASIPLAIPLLLFSYPIFSLLKEAKTSLKAFALSTLSVMIVAPLTSIFIHQHPETWKMTGMLVGVYTGGTPNLASIGYSLGVSQESFVLLNASDMILGGVYLLLLLTVMQRFLRLFLPAYQPLDEVSLDLDENAPITLKPALLSLGLSAGVVVLGAGLSLLIFGKVSEPFVFFVLTTLSLLLSTNARVQTLKCSYPIGNYLILVFCISIGQVVQFNNMVASSYDVFVFCGVVMIGTILLHFLLAKIFKLDAETTMMASTAAIYGPAMVGPVAQAVKTPSLIGPGLLMGLFGYALGNYLGLAIAYLTKMFILAVP